LQLQGKRRHLCTATPPTKCQPTCKAAPCTTACGQPALCYSRWLWKAHTLQCKECRPSSAYRRMVRKSAKDPASEACACHSRHALLSPWPVSHSTDCINRRLSQAGLTRCTGSPQVAHGAPARPPRPARASVVEQALGEVVALLSPWPVSHSTDCINRRLSQAGLTRCTGSPQVAHGAPARPPRPARASVVEQALGEVVALAAALRRRSLLAPAPVALIVVLLADVVVGHRRRPRRVLPRARVLPRGAPPSDSGPSVAASLGIAECRVQPRAHKVAGRLERQAGRVRARARPSVHYWRSSPARLHPRLPRRLWPRWRKGWEACTWGWRREACTPADQPAASARRAVHPCAPPRPAAPPPGGRQCAAQAAGTARPPRRPPGPPAGSRRPAPRAEGRRPTWRGG